MTVLAPDWRLFDGRRPSRREAADEPTYDFARVLPRQRGVMLRVEPAGEDVYRIAAVDFVRDNREDEAVVEQVLALAEWESAEFGGGATPFVRVVREGRGS